MDAAADICMTEEKRVRSYLAHWLAPIALTLTLGACSTVSDVWDGTTDAVGSLFSNDEDEIADETTAGYPDLAAVPANSPSLGSSSEREAATQGLIADRNQAQYTEQVRRRAPVAVRPLQDSESQPQALANDEPPPPQAAPVSEISQVDPAPRNRPSLAERLGVAPPPPPPASAENAPSPPAVPPVPGGTGTLTPPPVSTASTTIIGGGGGNSSAQFDNLANALSSYDASAYRVSTHITTVTFPTGSSQMTAADRRVLDDVIKLRTQYNGAVRVIGHASSRTQDLDPLRHKLANFRVSLNRANAVAAALMAKGLPADRLFVGAVSDNEPLYYEVMPAGESGNQRAEIFLDY
jgi:outer membrane protein OmpA-like peptidoglycan-associated protein